MGFKKYYNENKSENIFEHTFDKYYKRGHFGNINRDEIKKQQKDWFEKLKQIIEEKDFGSLMTVVEHRDSQVTRELFTKLTNINIKKLKAKIIREKLRKFCFNENVKPKPRKTFKDLLNEDS